MNIKFNWLFKLACASMATGITLGARFGHQGQLDEEGAKLFNKAQFYNLSNAIGLIACSLATSASIPFKIAAAGFVISQGLFTAPLFISAIKGKNSVLSSVMPLGGSSMIVGWSALVFA